jgi:hypothetical protein
MPGVKDPRKVRAFVVAARRAAGESDDAELSELGVHKPLVPEEEELTAEPGASGETVSPYDWDADT